MNDKRKKRQFKPVSPVQGLNSTLKNSGAEWDVIESDVLGSYTGTGYFDDYPVQDADDL